MSLSDGPAIELADHDQSDHRVPLQGGSSIIVKLLAEHVDQQSHSQEVVNDGRFRLYRIN